MLHEATEFKYYACNLLLLTVPRK